MARLTRRPRVAILALPACAASVLYGIYDVLRGAGRDWEVVVRGALGEERIDVHVIARNSEPLTLANGVRAVPDAALDAGHLYDVVVVPELMVLPDEPITGCFDPELAFLRDQHARGAVLATACSGALLLAEAGLLDGHEATTHWAFCETLQRRYPDVRVQSERALVITGEGDRFVMAGGGTSWLDLALYLVARLTDLDTAMHVARVNLVTWHEAGQLPFARLARTRQVDDAAIGKCQEWIARNYAASAPVASMVRLCGLPERTFKRRFAAAVGMAPLEYVHALRLERAKELLETSDAALQAIALEVGYEDATFFSRLFRRKVRMTPAHYRRRFGALRRALPAR